MSHKNVNAQGNVPFSWEAKPGVSKSSKAAHYDHHHCPVDVGVHEKKVPPPPPFSKQPSLKRSASAKGLRWWPGQDPFLAAYKECTKSEGNGKLSKLTRSKKISVSCKESSDVRDDNLVRFPNLPPLPRDGIRRQRVFVYPLRVLF
ncbi:hypothetical protein V6N13_052673 [Hibiscus sabdariffa]|uniref:Uncharacterized protein n=1 Tax=Hibiscus sabdariffa TaxID=183260 RepID=A0ABR2Q510_9ROSI